MQRSASKNCFHKKCATESPKIKPVEDPPRARKLVVGETEAGTSYGTERMSERNGCRKLNISAQIKNKKLPGRSFFQYFLSPQGTKKAENCFGPSFPFSSLFFFFLLFGHLLKGHTHYKVAPWELDGPRKAILRETIRNLFSVLANLI